MAKVEEGAWQKLGVAFTVVGVLVAVYFGIRSLPHSDATPPGPLTPTSSTSASPSSPSGQTSPSDYSSPAPNSPASKAGTKIGSWQTAIQDAGSLTYPPGIGSVIFTYWGSFGSIDPGNGVTLDVLTDSGLSSDAAFQACVNAGRTASQQPIPTQTLSAGDSICAFTPNDQVTWARIVSIPQGNLDPSATFLQVSVITWRESTN